MNETVTDERTCILLVDDEAQLALNLKLLLERDGFEVVVAADGREATAHLEARRFDLLITDLIMPCMDGTQLMSWVQQRDLDLPIVVITGYGSIESAVAAIRRGAYDYLTKPFDYELMKITVDKALERQRLKRALDEYTMQLEAKVLDRTRRLEEMQVRMMRAERLATVGELVSIIAHEIRNPLVAIGGFARRLARASGDDVQQLAGVIVSEVDRLESVLKSMLDLGKPARPKLRPIEADELVTRGLILFEGELKRAGIELRLELSPDLPQVLVDVDQIQGVVMNLVMNATQAMPRGGCLTIRTGLLGDGSVHLDVEDTGVGIAPDELEHLFDRFFTTRPTGTGLGLAIVQKVVEGHGGRVEVQSALGRGSRFRVVLPVSGSRAAEPAPAT